MLKYIFSVLLIAAVWTTVVLLELPIWIAIVATVVIVAVLAAFAAEGVEAGDDVLCGLLLGLRAPLPC